MAVPFESSETEEFTPASLQNLPSPPKFIFRAAGEREERAYRKLMQREGLEHHSVDTIRAETLKALRHLWSEDVYAANAAKLESYWALIDQNGKPDPAQVEAVQDLEVRLAKASPRIREMLADNDEVQRESPKICMAMFLVGWSGMDVGYGREEGRVPLIKIDALQDELKAMEEKALEAKIEGVGVPGTAFLQLCVKAFGVLGFTKDEEKNSSSPPPPQPDLSGSTPTPSAKTGGAGSKASAKSRQSK